MTIDMLIFDGVDEIDVMGPWEIFSGLSRFLDGIEVRQVTLAPVASVTAGNGTVLVPHGTLLDRPDLLVVSGSSQDDDIPGVLAGPLPAAIAARHAAGSTVASVCNGAQTLLEAGLLKGRPATANRGSVDKLRAAGVNVVEARVIDDGDIVTAGGVTSSLDLGLHLAERYFGAQIAEVAAHVIEYERRYPVWRREEAA
jgi:transcriptional regulator GlxA family with amidase domain